MEVSNEKTELKLEIKKLKLEVKAENQRVLALKQILGIYEVGFESLVKILNATPDFQYFNADRAKQQKSLKAITQVVINVRMMISLPESRKICNNLFPNGRFEEFPMPTKEKSTSVKSPFGLNPMEFENLLEITIPNPLKPPVIPRLSKLTILKYPSPPQFLTNGDMEESHKKSPLLHEELQNSDGTIFCTDPVVSDKSQDSKLKKQSADVLGTQDRWRPIRPKPVKIHKPSEQPAAVKRTWDSWEPEGNQVPIVQGVSNANVTGTIIASDFNSCLIKCLQAGMTKSTLTSADTTTSGDGLCDQTADKPDPYVFGDDTGMVLIENKTGLQIQNWQEHVGGNKSARVGNCNETKSAKLHHSLANSKAKKSNKRY